MGVRVGIRRLKKLKIYPTPKIKVTMSSNTQNKEYPIRRTTNVDFTKYRESYYGDKHSINTPKSRDESHPYVCPRPECGRRFKGEYNSRIHFCFA